MIKVENRKFQSLTTESYLICVCRESQLKPLSGGCYQDCFLVARCLVAAVYVVAEYRLQRRHTLKKKWSRQKLDKSWDCVMRFLPVTKATSNHHFSSRHRPARTQFDRGRCWHLVSSSVNCSNSIDLKCDFESRRISSYFCVEHSWLLWWSQPYVQHKQTLKYFVPILLIFVSIV